MLLSLSQGHTLPKALIHDNIKQASLNGFWGDKAGSLSLSPSLSLSHTHHKCSSHRRPSAVRHGLSAPMMTRRAKVIPCLLSFLVSLLLGDGCIAWSFSPLAGPLLTLAGSYAWASHARKQSTADLTGRPASQPASQPASSCRLHLSKTGEKRPSSFSQSSLPG